MLEPSSLIAAVAAGMEGQSASALMRLAEILKFHQSCVTVIAEQTVQDIEPEDILVGCNALQMRGVTIPYKDLKISSRIPHRNVLDPIDVMAGEACVLSYGSEAPVFLIVVDRLRGREFKMQYAEEAIDSVATHLSNTGGHLLISQDADSYAEVADPMAITVDAEGIDLGLGRFVAWDDVSGLSMREALSLAIGRKRMLTISEG